MKTTRRAFLKAATIAASMTSLLPFGKAAEQRKEKRNTQWNWRAGPWQGGMRKWMARVSVPDHYEVVKLMQEVGHTNSRQFYGTRKDCLLFGPVAWTPCLDGTRFISVSLTEYRSAYGFVNVLDGHTSQRLKRFRTHNRANFYKLMPGLHTLNNSAKNCAIS